MENGFKQLTNVTILTFCQLSREFFVIYQQRIDGFEGVDINC